MRFLIQRVHIVMLAVSAEWASEGRNLEFGRKLCRNTSAVVCLQVGGKLSLVRYPVPAAGNETKSPAAVG